MTCKDCVHYDVCEFNSFFYGGKHGEEKFKEYENSMLIEFACQNFKDKSRFVELPCKVGDTIYQIDGVRIYVSTIHEVTYTSSKVIFVTENIVFDEQAINNSIFLTPEEAKKALERSRDNA